MTEETKAEALDKLAKFTPKIGYPEQVARLLEPWRSRPTTWSATCSGPPSFELDRSLAKIGKPIDRDEWFMTPQTVNAYYNPLKNEIVFPAAILQPPFFNEHADDAVNYGGIGAVIGHEIGHGFDDQGSKYDGDGAPQRLVDRGRPDRVRGADRGADRPVRRAVARRRCPDTHVNGELTIGENIGDLGGLAIALKAYLIARGDATARADRRLHRRAAALPRPGARSGR